ncbi:MAG: hypothetical protein Q9171_002783 [Xanthocarpia ochracea]
MKALQAYHDAMPRPNQSVEDFKAYLARLEADLPPYTEEQRELHLQLRLRIAAQDRPPKHNGASHNTVSSRGYPVQNREPQNTAPKMRHPNQNREGQNTAPKRNHSGGQDRENEHPGPKRRRPTAPHDSIKREPDNISRFGGSCSACTTPSQHSITCDRKIMHYNRSVGFVVMDHMLAHGFLKGKEWNLRQPEADELEAQVLRFSQTPKQQQIKTLSGNR